MINQRSQRPVCSDIVIDLLQGMIELGNAAPPISHFSVPCRVKIITSARCSIARGQKRTGLQSERNVDVDQRGCPSSMPIIINGPRTFALGFTWEMEDGA